MSTHTHFAAIAGRQPFADWSRPLHVGFVRWLNSRRGRLGAGIANRPATYEVAPTQCARLIAYHHNNPVRAGVVPSAADSDWTSHRAYTSGNSPDWLRDDLGLELAGFGASGSGRDAFAEFVRASERDQWSLSDDELLGIRRNAREQLGASVEIGQPVVGESTQIPLYTPSTATLRKRWPGPLRRLARATAEESRIDQSVLISPHRARPIVKARRIFLLVALAAGRTLTEAAAYLNVSVPAASKSVSKADAKDRQRAQSIAESLGIADDLG